MKRIIITLLLLAFITAAAFAETYVDLNHDGESETIEVLSQGNAAELRVIWTTGAQTVATLPCPPTAGLLKIAGVYLNPASALPDVITLLYDELSRDYYIYVVNASQADSFVELPSADNSDYTITSTFARNYMLEVRSASAELFSTVSLPIETFEQLYRQDGTAPETLTAACSGFEDFYTTQSGNTFTITLIQYIRIAQSEDPIARVESTLAMRGGALALVGQRVAAE
ncbi:MAG: hypothetical protein LBD16_03395 [Oscillospiraceae bacterium]|jgi:hypothetical protein|nr:hypothetical protein [Oscillospiraceae bacterium]